MGNPDIKVTLEKLKVDVDDAVQQAYIDGFNAGSAYDKPTQDEFNEAHVEPVGYGEDGEIYVMSGAYNQQSALAKLELLFRKDMTPGSYGDLTENLRYTKIAYVPEDITSEPGYYYRGDGLGAYKAWVWTT